MRVAVLGLGGMGLALARRLRDQHHDVVVWNRTPGKAGDLVEAGSAVGAVTAADVVLVAVDGAAVQTVCTPELLAHLVGDKLLLIVGTVPPGIVRELDAALPGRVLDAPVLGTPDTVAAGRGRFLVGGGAEAMHVVSPVLDSLAAGYSHCGVVGTGMVMKILSNMQLVVGVAALAEAVATARLQGIADPVLAEVFADHLMVSRAASFGLGAMIDPHHVGVLGPVANATRDVELAIELAGDLRLVLSPGALELLIRVADRGWPDFTAVIEGLD